MHPVPSLQILLLPLPYLWVQERQGDARVSFLSLQAVLYWRVCHPFLATDLSEDFQTSGPPVIAEIHSQAPGQCGLWVTGGWYALGRCMNPHTHAQSHTVWAESVDDCGMYFLDSSLKSVFVPPSQPQALFGYSCSICQAPATSVSCRWHEQKLCCHLLVLWLKIPFILLGWQYEEQT